MGVEIRVVNTASPRLTKAAVEAGELSRPLQLAGMALQRSFVKQFALSGVPPWQPLAASTIARRRKHSSRPLQDTGRLRRSYVSRGAQGGIYELTKTSLTIGSNLVYAAVHQRGGTFARVSKPGRASMRRTKSGQYRFTKAGSKRAKLSAFWSGGRSYSVTIPARPLNVLQQDKAVIREIFKRHAVGALKPK